MGLGLIALIASGISNGYSRRVGYSYLPWYTSTYVATSVSARTVCEMASDSYVYCSWSRLRIIPRKQQREEGKVWVHQGVLFKRW